ncbi:MAG: hypothetical protein ACOWW1_05525 [archaeon]
MKIAVLGWGSLFWDPRMLKMSGEWKNDGPCLPIEFARVSSFNRLTLVIHPGVPCVKTLWINSACEDLRDAIQNLADREDTFASNIGFISIPDNESRCNVVKGILPIIESWATTKKIDALIWTDLASNRPKFTFEDVLDHLRGLKGEELKKAEEYVRKAPEQIRTERRSLIEQEFGWTPVNTCNKS